MTEAYVIAAEAQAPSDRLLILASPSWIARSGNSKIEPRYRQHLYKYSTAVASIPFASAEGGVLRLEAPGDEGGEAARLLLQIVENLKVIDAVLDGLANAKTSWWQFVCACRAWCAR